MSTNAPHHPDKLVGSKWTRVDPANRRRHWEVVAFEADRDVAVLRAVLDGEQLEEAWRKLRDRDRWRPGWE